jgi:hypothetical protein
MSSGPCIWLETGEISRLIYDDVTVSSYGDMQGKSFKITLFALKNCSRPHKTVTLSKALEALEAFGKSLKF